MARRVLFVTAFIVALAACKEEEPHPPPAGEQTTQPTPGGGGGGGDRSDAATSVPEGGSTDVDAGACTDLAIGGATSDEAAVADVAPAGAGTTITDGTYNLTNVQVFVGGAQAGPTGNTYRATVRITSGTTFERILVYAPQGGTPTTTRSRGVIATVGVSATVSLSCPLVTQEQYSFTATTTQLVLTDLVTKRQYTFARSP